jgi:multidrug resistance efflux pump
VCEYDICGLVDFIKLAQRVEVRVKLIDICGLLDFIKLAQRVEVRVKLTACYTHQQIHRTIVSVRRKMRFIGLNQAG